MLREQEHTESHPLNLSRKGVQAKAVTFLSSGVGAGGESTHVLLAELHSQQNSEILFCEEFQLSDVEFHSFCPCVVF